MASRNLALQFSIRLIKRNDPFDYSAGIQDPNFAGAKAGATHGVVNRLLLAQEHRHYGFFLCLPPLIVSVGCGSGRDEELSGCSGENGRNPPPLTLAPVTPSHSIGTFCQGNFMKHRSAKVGKTSSVSSASSVLIGEMGRRHIVSIVSKIVSRLTPVHVGKLTFLTIFSPTCASIKQEG
jgi:hypothetical protein